VLPPDRVGQARLLSRVGAARAVAPARPVGPEPSCAQLITGQPYAVEQNSLGLRSFTLTFPHSGDGQADALAHLELADRHLDLRVGLDGTYREALNDVDGIVPVSRGEWRSPCEFVFEMDLVGKIDHYTVSITFAGEKQRAARLTLVERTGLMREVTTAKAGK
jgi:hypothetical protein